MAGNYSDTLDADPSSGLAQLISKGGSDFFLLQLDSSGNFQWAISVGGPAQNDGASDIKIRDNSIYLSGTFQDSVDFDPSSATNLLTTQNSAINMFVMKFSPPTIGLNESRSTKTALKIYPNPSDNYVNIDNSKAEWNKLFILDLQGRLIMTNENLNSGIVDLNISNLPNGTYLMRMEGDKISAVDKFIIER
jgi:hypothetical protein